MMIILVPVNRGLYATFSFRDLDLADQTWTVNTHGYASQFNKGRTSFAHRIIAERMTGRQLRADEFVDHVNGNRLDNRRDNLRVVSASQNAHNRGKQSNNKSGFKGVVKVGNKWVAHIMHQHKLIHLGTFATPEEAALAYNQASLQYHGKHGRLNVIVMETSTNSN